MLVREKNTAFRVSGYTLKRNILSREIGVKQQIK